MADLLQTRADAINTPCRDPHLRERTRVQRRETHCRRPAQDSVWPTAPAPCQAESVGRPAAPRRQQQLNTVRPAPAQGRPARLRATGRPVDGGAVRPVGPQRHSLLAEGAQRPARPTGLRQGARYRGLSRQAQARSVGSAAAGPERRCSRAAAPLAGQAACGKFLERAESGRVLAILDRCYTLRNLQAGIRQLLPGKIPPSATHSSTSGARPACSPKPIRGPNLRNRSSSRPAPRPGPSRQPPDPD